MAKVKKEKDVITKINFMDLAGDDNFLFQNDKTEGFYPKDKKIPIGARIKYSELFLHNFKLEKQLSSAELLVTSELKMYDEIGLDASKAHKVTYITKEASLEGVTLVESFAFEIDKFREKYEPILKDNGCNHIDYLANPLLVYETLYTNEKLQPKNDLFIIIDEDEAYGLFYKEGKYISSKKIPSIADISKDLEANRVILTKEKIQNTLLTKGLDRDRYDMTEFETYDTIHNSFDTFLGKLSSISMHNRNVYGMMSIDRVFVIFDNKPIIGLKDMIANHFPEATFSSINFENDLRAIDLITASYILDKIKANDNSHNLTIFRKEPPFWSSEVGKLSIATAASILLIGAYPIYQQYKIGKFALKNNNLKSQLERVSASTSKLKIKNKKIERQIKKEEDKLKKIEQKFTKLEDISKALLVLKSQDSKYTPMLLTINDLLKKYKLSLGEVSQEGEGKLDLEVFSIGKKRNSIARFMNELLGKGYKSVSSNEITQENDRFKSIIRVQK